MARSFNFGRDQQPQTPEERARARAAANSLLANQQTPTDIGSGLNAVGRAMLYRELVAQAEAPTGDGPAASPVTRANPVAQALGLVPESAPAASRTPTVVESRSGRFVVKPDNPDLPSRVDFKRNEIRDGIILTAKALGIDPVDLATVMSYETSGTFNPRKKGPVTQWGQHRGFIQFGEPQAEEYGVDWDKPVGSQLGADGAVVKYLRDTGVRPGMGLLDIYSAINAGGVGKYEASDAQNGGAPGTVRDKVEKQMPPHRVKARKLLGLSDQTSPYLPQSAPIPEPRPAAQDAIGEPSSASSPYPAPNPERFGENPNTAPDQQMLQQALRDPVLLRRILSEIQGRPDNPDIFLPQSAPRPGVR